MSSTEGINWQTIESAMQNTTKSQETKKNDGLGKDQFLKLLTTQLKYQNPLKPMEDKEFISQMAQFSSLQHMQGVSKSMENLSSNLNQFMKYQQLTQASGLIGKEVKVLSNQSGDESQEDQAEIISGKVESIDMSNASPQLVVDGEKYSMTSIQEISG